MAYTCDFTRLPSSLNAHRETITRCLSAITEFDEVSGFLFVDNEEFGLVEYYGEFLSRESSVERMVFDYGISNALKVWELEYSQEDNGFLDGVIPTANGLALAIWHKHIQPISSS